MVKIAIVNPVVEDALAADALPPLPAYVSADVYWLAEGPSAIECRIDEARALAPLLDLAVAAADDGVDGIVLNCFMDPGLGPVRESVQIPVAPPAQSAMSLAVTLGERFSVILPAASGESIVRDQAHAYVGRDRLASVRSVEMPVAALSDHERLIGGLVEQAERALIDDGAHVIILGCTGMCHVTDAFRAALTDHNVPVIDPTLAAVGAVISQIIGGVGHSRRSYRLPSWRVGTDE